jgi:hypothetical protein
LWLVGVLVSYEENLLRDIIKCIWLILIDWVGICGVSFVVYRRWPTMKPWQRALMAAAVIVGVILFFTSVCMSVESL